MERQPTRTHQRTNGIIIGSMGKVTRQCILKTCSKDFYTTEYLLSIKKGKFCSKECCDLAKVGVPLSKV